MVLIIQSQTQIAIWNPDTFAAPPDMDHFTFERKHFLECFACLRRFLFQKLGDEAIIAGGDLNLCHIEYSSLFCFDFIRIFMNGIHENRSPHDDTDVLHRVHDHDDDMLCQGHIPGFLPDSF